MIQLTDVFCVLFYIQYSQQYMITISGWLYYQWSNYAAGTVHMNGSTGPTMNERQILKFKNQIDIFQNWFKTEVLQYKLCRQSNKELNLINQRLFNIVL
jgi:hypothetical protein